MSERGVIYMVWGDKVEAVLERSRRSLAEQHPELPVEVVRLTAEDPVKALLEKARMLRHTPFRETLFLDADTVVLGRLDFGFAKAQRFGLACCINECPWARRYPSLSGDMIEYNTGVLFFTETAKPLFEAWERLAPQLDSSIPFVHKGKPARMPFNDQCGFAAAVEETGIQPFVLPLNWNFRPKYHRAFFGPIKIWHDYDEVHPQILEFNRYYAQPKSIIQFHAA